MSLITSIISFGVNQLGGPSIPGQDDKKLDLSADTILLGIQFLVFGVGAWYFRRAASRLPDRIESSQSWFIVHLIALTVSVICPSTYVTGSAVQWFMTYVIRDVEFQRQLRNRQLHAEEQNSRGPAKNDETCWGDAFEIKRTVGTWNKDGVSAGVFPLAGKTCAARLVLIIRGRHGDPFPREKDLVGNLKAGPTSKD